MEARVIQLAVSPDESGNKLTAEQFTLGYAGEHQATQLQFTFPKTWSENGGLRFYVSLLAANGKAYKTELQEWPVTVLLPAAVTYEGHLYIQVVAVPVDDESLEVKKSSCFKGTIEKSLGGAQSLPEDATAGLLEQSLKDFYAAMQKLDETAKSLPYIGDNGNWYVYNSDLNSYEDTQKAALPESIATLDRQYAGIAAISTTDSFQMDEEQVLAGSEVILTLTNGPTTSCFVRSDHYPLYYYGTNQVVQPEYNTPIPVSAEDLIAGIKLNYGGAFTIKYQTAPSKVFFDYADNAAESAKKKYVPYAKNQITGHAEGITAEITDGAPGTFIKSAVVRGKSAVDETTGAITPLSPAVIVASSNDGTVENHVNLPTGLQLYGTPNNQYYDTYNAITGKLTRNCGKVLLASVGWIYGYSTSAAAVTWITANNYVPSKTYYLVHNGTVSTQTTDWQGKISLTINKADAGITAEDTAAAAAQKMKAYWGEAYAVLPLKTPTTEQFEPVQLAIPTKVCAVVCNNGYLDVTYCRDIDTAYLDLLEYTTGLEARIAQLEISTGGGETI